jgi:tetraacyldisaccharide 4'-kinase
MMAEPRFWGQKTALVSLALMPVSFLYRMAEALNRKLTHQQHPGKPVICVGNLTAGGGGKTPTVQLIEKWLREDGLHPAILSRGYGGTVKGPLKVDPQRHNAHEVGDEPLMLAHQAHVYIGADRMASLRAAVADGHDVLIKDDGFQNPAMAHHFNLIVVDAASAIGNGRVLPAGPLRQSLPVAFSRLDALLVIGDSEAAHPSLALLLDMVEALGKPVFYGRMIALQKDEQKGEGKGGGAYHAFCGIAKPEKFAASLVAAGYDPVQMTIFADHHNFTAAEAEKLLAETKPLITTRKDMMRLASAPKGTPQAALAASAEVLDIVLEVDAGDALRTAMRTAMAHKQANRLYKSY